MQSSNRTTGKSLIEKWVRVKQNMYISINNLLYSIGAIISILVLFSSSSNIPSFFSRKRIFQLLRDENQDLDSALKKLRKWYFYNYDVFTVVPITAIFLVLDISGVLQFTSYVSSIIIIIVYSAFIVFYLGIIWKLPSIFRKNVDEITASLRKIVDWIKIFNTVIVSTIVMVALSNVGNILSNRSMVEGLLQIIEIFVLGTFAIAYTLSLSGLIIRGIEGRYLVKLKNEGKLPSVSVKINLKGKDKPIIGDLVSFDLSKFVVQEADGYRLSLEYNKVDTIGSMTKKNEHIPK
jgi:hypothetical protein